MILLSLLMANFSDGSLAPLPESVGGYAPGDLVFNGHYADSETLAACGVLWSTYESQRDCMRVASCESGSDHAAVNDNGDGHADLGRWQHNTRYVSDRLDGVGLPDGDPLDLWTNALMTRWYYDRLGGTFGTTAGWHCASIVGAS